MAVAVNMEMREILGIVAAALIGASACASSQPQSQVVAQPTPTIVGAEKPAATLTAISALQVTATPVPTTEPSAPWWRSWWRR